MSQQIEIPNHVYRPLQFGIRDMLALMLIVAILASSSQFPPSLLHAFLLIIALYLIKIRIAYLRTSPVVTILLYLITVIALLPYLYLCAPFDWDYVDSSPLANWVGGPIAVFTVPMISFLYDICLQRHHRLWVWIVRSLIEIVVIIPIWVILWAQFELFVLNWILV